MGNTLRERFFTTKEGFCPVKDAADRLGVTEGAVRQMLQEGRIQGLKAGGRIWIWKPSVDDLVREYPMDGDDHGTTTPDPQDKTENEE